MTFSRTAIEDRLHDEAAAALAEVVRDFRALQLHHSEHHAPCDWQSIDPPSVAVGSRRGQRPGAAETSEDLDSSGTVTARRRVGSAPTAPESLDR